MLIFRSFNYKNCLLYCVRYNLIRYAFIVSVAWCVLHLPLNKILHGNNLVFTHYSVSVLYYTTKHTYLHSTYKPRYHSTSTLFCQHHCNTPPFWTIPTYLHILQRSFAFLRFCQSLRKCLYQHPTSLSLLLIANYLCVIHKSRVHLPLLQTLAASCGSLIRIQNTGNSAGLAWGCRPYIHIHREALRSVLHRLRAVVNAMTNYNRFNPPTFVNNASQHSNGQQDRRVSGDMNGLGAMNGGIIATSHPAFQVQSLQQSQQQQSRLGDAGLVQGRKDLSRHNSATQFATPTDTMDASLQQAMMDFGNAQNNPSLSQFVFNPAMGTSMNNNLTGQYDVQMSQLHGQGNASNVPLSINTQYNNLMGYNGLSATSNNYQSPFDADMSSTFMNTGGDMSMDLSMMNDEEIAVINDLFSAQQFGSPSFTSPMNSTFDASMYGPQASGTIGNMDAAQMNIMVPNLPSSNIQLDESQSHVTELRKNSMQSEDEIILPDNKQEVPASTIASNPTNRKSKTQMTHETIGGIKLPWMTPAGEMISIDNYMS